MGHEESTTSRTPKQELGDAVEVHCSRERSRAAWKIIEEYLMPFVDKERYQLSRRCRLHPDNDLYRDQEQHKIRLDINEWQCGYCKKSFYEEKYLDKHFDNRHYNLLNVSHSRCLADVCGALHCDHVMDISLKTKCNPAAAARNHLLCESLADSCFPVNEGPSASRLHGSSMSSSYANSVMPTLAREIRNPSLEDERGIKRGPQKLIRVSQSGRKKKPS
ncbi:hypothetical protein FEM48_Zijuj04G0015700 [Ziziphus jujuba var. spinosa]|uniref:C2H2-type domain-containing protein n=1 Tax=Ziziphus jujuba var. spinosa TaxID=714518 RepID=A0A978VH32_ZIZJJ|nr:hypothetical protein FEM48_Zijuj04G0015700 [Ziziphus jujuba var. spinosa]